MSSPPTVTRVRNNVLGVINRAKNPMSREEIAATLYPNLNKKEHLAAVALQAQVYAAISELEAEHRLILNDEDPPRYIASSRGKESYKNS